MGSDWEPIATAPKDGTYILVFEYPSKPLDTLYWSDFDQEWRNGYNNHPAYPTHWMPLPEPPGAVCAEDRT
jgi:hypothetical protein